MRHETVDDLVERNGAAARRGAVALLLGAAVEVAEPAEITIRPRLDQEDLHLVADRAWPGPGLVGRSHGAIAGAADVAQPMLRADPHREIEILAFVPDLDAGLAKLAKARHLFPEGLRHRADDGGRLDLLERGQRVGDDISGSAEVVLLTQQNLVLPFDLGARYHLVPVGRARLWRSGHAAAHGGGSVPNHHRLRPWHFEAAVSQHKL